MKTIIVPLDGSNLAEQALGLAAALARVLGARVDLVHVRKNAPILYALPNVVVLDGAEPEIYLERVGKELPQDIPYQTTVLTGGASDALLHYIDAAPDALVVMTTHGRGAAGRAVLGSVADAVLRRSPVPIIVMRRECEVETTTLRMLFVPLDGSDVAEGALPLAAELARTCGATIRLFRHTDVFQMVPLVGVGLGAADVATDVAAELGGEARTYLESVASRLRDEGLTVSVSVHSATPGALADVLPPAEEIIRAAGTAGADLIIMSTHGRGGLRRWAFGSVTDDVMRHSPIPVAVVPPLAAAVHAEMTKPRVLYAAG